MNDERGRVSEVAERWRDYGGNSEGNLWKAERDRNREESGETKHKIIYFNPCNMFTSS